ncbi:D-Ala-D-Ala carboxypeptidase family metallohydrolase [Phyllobacterium phragmitis]|uniref:YcbK family protein n=1 Tax=Phyllobacterium phragmitis TaxID=2670329 RepID=A0ABQ0GZR8_9HYPH
MLSFAVTSCTSTGSDVAPQLQAQGEGSSLIADTMASAAESTAQSASAAIPSDKPDTPASNNAALALAESRPANPAEQSLVQEVKPADQAKPATAEAAETGATAGAASSGNSPAPSPSPLVANAAASPEAAPAAGEKESAPAAASEPETKDIKAVSFAASPRQVAFATPPNRASQSGGTIMRLFSDRAKKPEEARILEKPAEKKAEVTVSAPKAPREYNYALPGVRENFGIEIKRRASLDDDSDIDAHEEDESFPVQLASAGGLARLAPNGLRTQRESVDVACLKPQLVSMLKAIERRFGRPVMVTSGYRSPSHNRAVNGARRSLHMMCAAADIQVDGVSKWEIAKFVRSMPNRGGVGTYCHTRSVHVDIGPERDWNWRCVRRN